MKNAIGNIIITMQALTSVIVSSFFSINMFYRLALSVPVEKLGFRPALLIGMALLIISLIFFVVISSILFRISSKTFLELWKKF